MAPDSSSSLATPSGQDKFLIPPAVEQLFRELTAQIRAVRPKEDLTPLERAYQFAAIQHGLQKRSSGEPYMIHPLEVTRTLAEMNMDMVTLETGLLHDVVEDTGTGIEEIRKRVR